MKRKTLEAFRFDPQNLPGKTQIRKLSAAKVTIKKTETEIETTKLITPSSTTSKENAAKEKNGDFVAPKPNKYRERFQSVCEECFETSARCTHFKPKPLRLLLVGHNPSDHAWKSGFFYSNPTNRMWKLLTGQSLGSGHDDFDGILPKTCKIESQNGLCENFGIGLTDVVLEPGSDASKFPKRVMLEWGQHLVKRLQRHVEMTNLEPQFVAFAGVRQFRMIFEKNIPGKIESGEWKGDMPNNWPLKTSRIFILPSSSGRAVMTHADRSRPYKELALELKRNTPI